MYSNEAGFTKVSSAYRLQNGVRMNCVRQSKLNMCGKQRTHQAIGCSYQCKSFEILFGLWHHLHNRNLS